MIKFLNKRFPNDNYPPIIIHIYYLLISFTFCYLYYHKFILRANFHERGSSGLYSVINLDAVKPVQYRVFVPYLFAAVKSVADFIYHIPDKALFFIMTIGFCYLILLSFYFLLNEYFKSKATNCWLAPIIIYPMIWNFVIMNGQFFYMDYTVLLIIILGFYATITDKYGWLLVIFLLGVLNHPSVGYLIPAFLIFNYKKLLNPKTILYTAIMSVMYLGIYKLMDYLFPATEGYFVIYNLPRNLGIFNLVPLHIVIRDFFFNFGGLHIIFFLFFVLGLWKRFKGPMLYINLVVFPYVISVLINFSIEEIRNYIAIIPYVIITSLLFLSSFENNFIKPVDKVFTGSGQN